MILSTPHSKKAKMCIRDSYLLDATTGVELAAPLTVEVAISL